MCPSELMAGTITKSDVRVVAGHPALQRMWDKRQRGYRAMGYRTMEDADQ